MVGWRPGSGNVPAHGYMVHIYSLWDECRRLPRPMGQPNVKFSRRLRLRHRKHVTRALLTWRVTRLCSVRPFPPAALNWITALFWRILLPLSLSPSDWYTYFMPSMFFAGDHGLWELQITKSYYHILHSLLRKLTHRWEFAIFAFLRLTQTQTSSLLLPQFLLNHFFWGKRRHSCNFSAEPQNWILR